MMIKQVITRSLLTLVILGACLMTTTGCRSKGNPNGNGDELNPIDVIDGDYPLLPIADAELGQRVTEAQFHSVSFGFDSAQISRSERPKLEAVAQYLRRTSARTRIVLEGNCDERGSRVYNVALGERRALAARAYLIGLGIDPARLLTKSYGEEQPADPGHDERAWRLNRRVEPVAYRK
jgi:outer membrane protein OmpA-like peptidoglycan-associated protein